MNYCPNCNILTEAARCHVCGNKKIREVEKEDFCYFITLHEFYSEMFESALKEKNIEVVAVPFYRTPPHYATAGRADSRRLFIRYKNSEEAHEIYESLFFREED